MSNKIIPFPLSPRQQRQATKAVEKHAGEEPGYPREHPERIVEASPALPQARRIPSDPGLPGFLVDGPVAALLVTAGHSRACISRLRSGLSITCSCGAVSEPEDEAARAIGHAIRFAKMGAARQVPIPPRVIAGLVEQVDGGTHSDLARATELATAMETSLGFGKHLPLLYRDPNHWQALIRQDVKLARRVHRRLARAEASARRLVHRHRPQLVMIADRLEAHGTLEGLDLSVLVAQLRAEAPSR